MHCCDAITDMDFFDASTNSVKFDSGVKGGSGRLNLGGSAILLWKPQSAVDDSTMEELPGGRAFEGMREEVSNLEKCKTGEIIAHQELEHLKGKRDHVRVIQSR